MKLTRPYVIENIELEEEEESTLLAAAKILNDIDCAIGERTLYINNTSGFHNAIEVSNAVELIENIVNGAYVEMEEE